MIHHHHAIGGCFHEAAVSALHLRQVLFSIFAHGDVADCRGDQDTLGAFERAEHDLDGKLASVFAFSVQLNAGADLLRQGFGGGAGSIGDQPFGKAGGNDVGHFLAEEFVTAVAKLLFGLSVEQNNFAILVHHHHAVGSGFKQSAVPHFRLFVLAQVAADIREAAQIAGRIAQGDEGDAGQELGLILAHAHAEFLVAAVGGSQTKHFFRPAPADVFGHKEAREVLADYLLRGVSLDMRGTGAPTDHGAARIEHEDGIVLHSVEEHAVFFFALLQGFLGGGAPDAVAHRGPGGEAGDQDSEKGSDDQNHPGLVPVAIGFRHANCKQAQFFILHSDNDRLKLIIDLVVGSEADGGNRRVDAFVAAQADNHVRMLDPFGGQGFNGGEMNLLHRVVRGEGADGRLILFGLQHI